MIECEIVKSFRPRRRIDENRRVGHQDQCEDGEWRGEVWRNLGEKVWNRSETELCQYDAPEATKADEGYVQSV